jgi:hypothetical protein
VGSLLVHLLCTPLTSSVVPAVLPCGDGRPTKAIDLPATRPR